MWFGMCEMRGKRKFVNEFGIGGIFWGNEGKWFEMRGLGGRDRELGRSRGRTRGSTSESGFDRSEPRDFEQRGLGPPSGLTAIGITLHSPKIGLRESIQTARHPSRACQTLQRSADAPQAPKSRLGTIVVDTRASELALKKTFKMIEKRLP